MKEASHTRSKHRLQQPIKQSKPPANKQFGQPPYNLYSSNTSRVHTRRKLRLDRSWRMTTQVDLAESRLTTQSRLRLESRLPTTKYTNCHQSNLNEQNIKHSHKQTNITPARKEKQHTNKRPNGQTDERQAK